MLLSCTQKLTMMLTPAKLEHTPAHIPSQTSCNSSADTSDALPENLLDLLHACKNGHVNVFLSHVDYEPSDDCWLHLQQEPFWAQRGPTQDAVHSGRRPHNCTVRLPSLFQHCIEMIMLVLCCNERRSSLHHGSFSSAATPEPSLLQGNNPAPAILYQGTRRAHPLFQYELLTLLKRPLCKPQTTVKKPFIMTFAWQTSGRLASDHDTCRARLTKSLLETG